MFYRATFITFVLGLILTVGLMAPVSRAEGPVAPVRQANGQGRFPVSQGGGPNVSPAVPMDYEGNFVVAGQSDYLVKAQRHHANGAPNGVILTEQGGPARFFDVTGPSFLIPGDSYDQNPGANVVSYDLAFGPQEAQLYATRYDLTGSDAQDALVVYQRDATTGQLTFMEANPNVIDPYSVVVSPDGKHVYVASFDDSLSIFERHSDGSVTFLQAITVVNGALNRHMAMSANGERLFVVGYNHLTVFARDPNTGSLISLQSFDGVQGETITLSPDGAHLYVARNNDPGLSVYKIIAGQLLEFVENQQGNLVGLVNARDVKVSPDGNYVYTFNHKDGVGGAIGIFKRDATTGQLTYDGFVQNGLDGVELPFDRAMALSPDGAYLFVGTAVFVRDQQTGALTFAEREGNVPVRRMIVSQNSEHVYLSNAGAGDDIQLYYAYVEIRLIYLPLVIK